MEFPVRVISALFAVLGIVGAVALVLRVFRSIGGTLLATAGLAAARAGGDTSANRGDVTGMLEGRAAERRARATLVKAVVGGAAWLLWLVAPIPLDLIPGAYAAAAILWFFPGRRPGPPAEASGST
jgi:hypothetical protein